MSKLRTNVFSNSTVKLELPDDDMSTENIAPAPVEDEEPPAKAEPKPEKATPKKEPAKKVPKASGPAPEIVRLEDVPLEENVETRRLNYKVRESTVMDLKALAKKRFLSGNRMAQEVLVPPLTVGLPESLTLTLSERLMAVDKIPGTPKDTKKADLVAALPVPCIEKLEELSAKYSEQFEMKVTKGHVVDILIDDYLSKI